jgi:hypothetical protein
MSRIYALPVNLVVVQSPPGAKGDFLAGWLGTLPEFLDSQWTIDCETGQSVTHAKFFKEFKIGNNLDLFLAEKNFCLSDQPQFLVAASTHAPFSSAFSSEQLKNIKIIAVRASHSKILEIAWNRFVKNCFTRHRCKWSTWKNVAFGVDEFLRNHNPITDDIRCSWIDKNLNSFFSMKILVDPGSHYVFDYDEIFTPEGSHIVAEALNFECLPQHHKLWQKNLDFSSSPNVIERFGQTYSFEDFKHRFENQMRHRLLQHPK